MSLRCVEMSPFLSGKLSFVRLFSYTFRLRSSFINIFFSGLAPGATFPLRRHDGTSPTSDNLSCVFRVGLGIRPFLRVTRWGCRALHPQAKPEPRFLVNRNLGHFPTGRKKFYKWSALFPPGRKPGVAGCRYSTPRAPSHPGRRRAKNVEAPAVGETHEKSAKQR